MMKIKMLLIIGLFLVFSFGCSKKDQPKEGTRVKQTEKKEVKNTSAPLYGKVSLQLKEAFKFKPKHEQLESISRFEQDKGGNFYFFDGRTKKIFKFTKEGKFITHFGGKGEGPGEFKGNIRDMVILNQKLIVFSRSKLLRFDLEGNLLNENKIDKFYWPVQIVGENKFLVRFSKSIGKGEDAKRLSVIALMNENEEILNNYFEGENLGSTRIKTKSLELSFASTYITRDVGFRFNRNNQLIYTFISDQYVIKVLNLSGERQLTYSRPWVRKTLDENDAKVIVEQFRNIPPSQKDSIGKHLPEYLCAISHIQTLPGGFLAVAALRGTNDFEWHLFDREGKFTCVMNLPEDLGLKTLPRYSGKKMSGIVETEEGDEYCEYEIVNYDEVFKK